MVKQVTFSSSGNNYTATDQDIFMDNGARVVYIKDGRNSHPEAKRIEIPSREWFRILPKLAMVDYEKYYGRKPLLNGVVIYQLKQK